MNSLKINPKEEKRKIIQFIKYTLENESFQNVVIGASGGIDSTTSLYLLKEATSTKNIFIAHLFYFEPDSSLPTILKESAILPENFYNLSIKSIVDKLAKTLGVQPLKDSIRLGNIMARVRMILLYDLAKKHQAL
ncbi:hypothetical protein HYU95_00300, partial [Candidatus Daviesbacteria bacterium]|nr:hypothetical protein [Candidatus Daviesbacteria bacterium]